MAKRANVVQLKRRKTMNIGIVIFLMIFIYIIVYIVFYFTRSHLSIYEVTRESLSIESISTGVIIREESVYYTSMSGFINFYLRDGARAKKNATIYSVDENKTIYDTLVSNEDSLGLKEEDVIELKNKISNFKKKYTNDDYSFVLSVKEDLISSMLTMIDANLMDQLVTITNEMGLTTSFNTIKTEKSGVITYHVDSLDELTEEEVTSATFDLTNFTQDSTRTTNIMGANSKVYKMITSENWKIIALIDSKIYELLLEKNSVRIRILENDLILTVPVTVERIDSEYYAKLSLDKYMIQYKNKRFLEIEFLIQSESGLKIPLSAITERMFSMIPVEYLTYDSDTNERGVTIRTYSSNGGEPIFTFVSTEVYFEEAGYAYVNNDMLTYNTYLVSGDNEERVTLTGPLEGVYNVNKGFAVFRRIERISENDEYCIIKEGTTNGLALYDHIALDASTAEDSKIIY